MDPVSAPRQLVICCDGTNNNLTGGAQDTNVVKLAQLFARSPAGPSEMLFYDPGVGNPGELPGATLLDTWGRRAQRLAGLAFGRGVYENMAECYLFLMRHYRPGDAIYIFGFSRGAFTARSLGGLINQFGVLMPHMESMLPTLIHIYFSDRDLAPEQMAAIARQTSELFAPVDARQVDITFMGVWDTVASVGMWPFQARITAIPTIQGKRFLNVRQAVALDEHRAQFQPRLYVDNNGSYASASGKSASIQQLWFRGCHCDVGGGYAAGETAISDQALAWLLSQAVQCGLRLNHAGVALDSEAAVATALRQTPAPVPALRLHSELHNTPLWALTGMVVRDTCRVAMDGGRTYTVVPVEHASVAASEAGIAQHSAWTRTRSKKGLWRGLLVMLLLPLLLGHWLAAPGHTGPALSDWAQLPGELGYFLQRDYDFAYWQLLWWLDLSPRPGLAGFAAPQWALAWDFALIAAYAYVLSWLAVAAFARAAGLQRAADPVPRWLNRLGWALPLAVFGDVFENLATLAVIACNSMDWTLLGLVVAPAMTLCAVAKWLGSAGVLVLILVPAKRRVLAQRKP